MAGKDTKLAPDPAPDPFLNPPSTRYPLGGAKLRILRKRIYTLGKLIDRRDRAAASSCPTRDHAFTKQLQWAWEGEEEEEEKRVDSISINACRRQIRHWERCSRKKPAGAGLGGPKSLLRKEIDKWLLLEIDERPLWRIYKALLAEQECGASVPAGASDLVEELQQVGRSPTGAPATSPGRDEDARGASQPAASSGLVEDIQRIGRLEFDYAGREIDPDKR